MVQRTDLDPRAHDWRSLLLDPMRQIGARVAELFSPSAEAAGKNHYFSERAYGRFRRSFQLPGDADLDSIGAAHRDGVLTVTAPGRASQSSEGRRIPVSRG